MDETKRDNYEPLIEGLESVPPEAFGLPRPPAGLQESIFAQTCRVVRAKARQRRLVALGVVAAAYMAGITTALLWTETPGRMNSGALLTSPSIDKERKDEPFPSYIEPSELVRRSETASPEDRIRLLKQAGDIYLSDQYEIEKALQCYRRALDSRPQSLQMRVEPDDSWLLAALKDARR